jgi:predicted nucleic acid-binding protein
VLDTSVAVDHLRGRPDARALLRTLLLDGDELAGSEVLRLELLAGARPDEEDLVESFFEALGWVPVSEEIARLAGGLARRYRPSHSGIDDADYLIAATALLLEADLLTTNVRHYPMLPGLEPAY